MKEMCCLWVFISVVMIVLTLIFGVCVINNWHKRKMLNMEQEHEKKLQSDNWERKMQWEEKVAENYRSTNKIRNDNEDLKNKVEELWKSKDIIPPLDLNRIALLHLLLTDSKKALTPDILQKEVDKVKKSYELLRDYVK